jgi:hypothetical protein
MAYLYRHIRLDKNEPFYIGIGTDIEYKRAYNFYNRSNHWKNIINKTQYEVEILLDDLTWEEACQKEIEFITLYGRKDLNKGTLVNLTDGGEGFLGYKHTQNAKDVISQKLLGKSKHTQEQKLIWSLLRKNKSNPKGGGKGVLRPQTSQKHKGRISPNKGKGNPVILYKITGEYVKTYSNYNDLAFDLQINPETVRCHLIGKAKTIKNKLYKAQYK